MRDFYHAHKWTSCPVATLPVHHQLPEAVYCQWDSEVMKHVGWPPLVMLLSCHNWSPWVYWWRLDNTFNEARGDKFDSYLQNSCFNPITPPFTTVTFYLWCCIVRNSFPNTSHEKLPPLWHHSSVCLPRISPCIGAAGHSLLNGKVRFTLSLHKSNWLLQSWMNRWIETQQARRQKVVYV